MSSRKIIVGPDAEEDILNVDTWWRENRLAAPDLFLNELTHALALIAAPHYVGPRYVNRLYPGMRRYLMRSTRYHVYYLPRDQDLVIVAIWGAVRGITPEFKQRRRRIESGP
jgi:plasmid stabilization system protein ParE